MTAGPSTYIVTTTVEASTLGQNVKASVAESCDLSGTTAASCRLTIAGTVGERSTTTSTTSVLSGTRYRRFDVAITGGADKIANPTACASPTGGAGSLNPRNMALWAVAGVLGAASILAM